MVDPVFILIYLKRDVVGQSAFRFEAQLDCLRISIVFLDVERPRWRCAELAQYLLAIFASSLARSKQEGVKDNLSGRLLSSQVLYFLR